MSDLYTKEELDGIIAWAKEADAYSLEELELILMARKLDFMQFVNFAAFVLDRYYPEDIFTGESRDPGPLFLQKFREGIALVREKVE